MSVLERFETPTTAFPTTRRSVSISKEEIRGVSEWIRHSLDSQIDHARGDGLDDETTNRLITFLTVLDSTKISNADVRYSGIDRVLLDICGPQTRWPAHLVEKAEKALQVLELKVGSLRGPKLRAPRAHGRHSTSKIFQGGWIKKVAAHDSNTDQKTRDLGSVRAYEAGHNGFAVGDWWGTAADAYASGIVDSSQDGITSDEDGAYAILFGDYGEVGLDEPDEAVYVASSATKGRFRLMQNIQSFVGIRVLRSWRSNSKWAPRGGIRYDGLYKVVGFGVKLIIGEKDEWIYTFKLSREEGQPKLESALRRPTAEEYDSWKANRKAEGDIVAANSASLPPSAKMESEMEKPEEGDEGYFGRALRHGYEQKYETG